MSSIEKTSVPETKPEIASTSSNTTNSAHVHKKSNRCAVQGCNSRPARIIGHCRYCQLNFCSTHRLPETHDCSKLDFCKATSFQNNSEKLLREKCVKLKV